MRGPSRLRKGQEMSKKSKWCKPKLIVLVRGKSEEIVLETCKSGGSPGESNNTNYGGCSAEGILGPETCVECGAFYNS